MSPSLETFLLCSAALANLTTLCPAALPVVTDAALVAVLLGHPAAAARSVYILEQLVTVLVNLAKLPHARNQMTQVSRADDLISKVVQSRRRPLLGPSPG